MKKNYLEPMIKVQSVALQSLMQTVSPGELGISEEPITGGGGAHDRSDLLDDWN